MHELSIAVSIVEALEEELARQPQGNATKATVRIGALSGVVHQALEFAWDVATEGSRLEGARLEIESVPAVAWCGKCASEQELKELLMRCPTCGQPTPELRSGQELEIVSMELAQQTSGRHTDSH